MANNVRYFLHLNPQDENFQKITELDYIDDIDPNFVLYYFKDGTKCNKDYIGNINEKNVYGKYEFTEVSHPNNAWVFEITDIKHEVKYATNANGERVEIADILDRQDTPAQEGKRVTVKKSPAFVVINDKSKEEPTNVEPTQVQPVDESPAKTTDEFNFNSAIKNEGPTLINAEKNKDQKIEIAGENGNTIIVSLDDLVKKYNQKPEVKIVEKVVEKEVLVNKDTIKIDLDSNQKSLIENMIDMSQKETCDIDMGITLSLPPVSVYNIIKTVYPEGMAKAFVNIIANRMDIKELKKSVAEGLLSYYDNDANVVIETNNSDK